MDYRVYLLCIFPMCLTHYVVLCLIAYGRLVKAIAVAADGVGF